MTEYLFFLAFILLVSAAIVKSIEKKKAKKNQQNYYTTNIYNSPQDTNTFIQPSYMPYKRKNLLTKTEYNFYITLKNICDSFNLRICPKVRLEDIAEVTDKTYINKYRGYIKSRHVDFIICDNNLYALCAIELDDYSHNTFKAQGIDEFKNNLFTTIRLPLFRIIVGSNYVYEIQNMLNTLNIRNPLNSNIHGNNNMATFNNNNSHLNNDINMILNKQNELLEKQNQLVINLQNTISNMENSNKQE